MGLFAHILAYIFHPLLILSYCLLILLSADPYGFGVSSPWEKMPLIVITLLYTFFLPLITTIFMVLTGLIDSIYLPKKEDRIGPLIAAIIFYTWFLMNVLDNPEIPAVFNVLCLGSLIALSLSFLLNIFSKISLHAVGMGGLMGACFILYAYYEYETILIGHYSIHFFVFLLVVIVLSGLVGSSRLSLSAHIKKDIYGGALVGFASQLLAMRFLV